MLFFPRRIEHAFDVTIQRSHHTYSGEHHWPFMFCNQCEVEDLGRGADRIKCLECGGDANWGKFAPEIAFDQAAKSHVDWELIAFPNAL